MQNYSSKFKILFMAIIGLFVFTSFLGFGHLYHQDEYRWASIANPVFGELHSPHPPLPEFLFGLVGKFIGYDYLRIVPLVFGFLNLILIYLVLLKTTGKKAVGLIGA